MDIPKAGEFIKLLTWLTEVWFSFATPTAGRILIFKTDLNTVFNQSRVDSVFMKVQL